MLIFETPAKPPGVSKIREPLWEIAEIRIFRPVQKGQKSSLEPVAELTIASTKNPLGLMASLGIPMGFMAFLGDV
jgi:hypothetical protein